MEPQSVSEDRKNNVVFIYAKMVGELKCLGSWENEALLMMGMFEDEGSDLFGPARTLALIGIKMAG